MWVSRRLPVEEAHPGVSFTYLSCYDEVPVLMLHPALPLPDAMCAQQTARPTLTDPVESSTHRRRTPPTLGTVPRPGVAGYRGLIDKVQAATVGGLSRRNPHYNLHYSGTAGANE